MAEFDEMNVAKSIAASLQQTEAGPGAWYGLGNQRFLITFMYGGDERLQVLDWRGERNCAFRSDYVNSGLNRIAYLFPDIFRSPLEQRLGVVHITDQAHAMTDLCDGNLGVHLPFKVVTIEAGIGEKLEPVQTISAHMKNKRPLDL
jgi:hypothetical protein